MTLSLFRHFNSFIPHHHVWIIGNFDGIHKGHCSLIDTAMNIARLTNKKTGILSFYPHPRQFFNPSALPINMMQSAEKIHLLNTMQIDYYYLHPFNKTVADMSALDFCLKIKQQLNPSSLIIGHDFHFGKGRSGTPTLLENFCQQHHIECHIIPPHLSPKGIRYASETIREFLANGDIASVKSFLPHDYILSGRVIHGKKLARHLGFPTANILLKNVFLPKFGVYKCRILNMDNMLAIVNIGIKPTINHNTPLMEVHIPNFNADLYGKKLRIAFDAFIRPEIKFASLDILKTQIQKDVMELLN